MPHYNEAVLRYDDATIKLTNEALQRFEDLKNQVESLNLELSRYQALGYTKKAEKTVDKIHRLTSGGVARILMTDQGGKFMSEHYSNVLEAFRDYCGIEPGPESEGKFSESGRYIDGQMLASGDKDSDD